MADRGWAWLGGVLRRRAAAATAIRTLAQGAELQTTTERFGKLAASNRLHGDALLGKLREATKGMISDAELMASASRHVSRGWPTMKNRSPALPPLSATLGWDMQQVAS
jgi:hypothetical protein